MKCNYFNFASGCVYAVLICSCLFGRAGEAAEIDWDALFDKASEPRLRRVEGQGNWYFLPAELKHLATSVADSPPPAKGVDPVEAVFEFHQALEKRGVQLILLPVPAKAKIRVDRLISDLEPGDRAAAEKLDLATGRYLDRLRKMGVEVFDPSDLFRQWLKQGRAPIYCRSDSHFSPNTCEKLAEAVLEFLPKEWVKKPANEQLQESSIEIVGDLAGEGEVEELKMTIAKNEQTQALFAPDDSSPILLLGDSHCLVFHSGRDMHAEGAGLFDHLAARLKTPPALIAVRGSGSTSARVALFRKAKRSADFLKSKKVVIWCFAAREFTQNEGWKKIPLP